MRKPLAAALAALVTAAAPAAAASLDAGFGGGGTAILPAANSQLSATMVVQPDGKIVVGGATVDPASGRDFAIGRFHADGTPDAGFGTNGFVQVSLSTVVDEVVAVAVQPDGKIVAAGYADAPGAAEDDTAVVRLNPDGSLDTATDSTPATAFGDGADGTLVLDVAGSASSEDYGEGVAVQQGGQIVVGLGIQVGSGDDYDFGLLRLTPAGLPDASFGPGGLQKVNIATGDDRADFPDAMLQLPDGRLLLAGRSNMSGGATTDYAFSFARFNPDGTRDTATDGDPTTSFGTDGTTTAQIGNGDDLVLDMARQPDGKIVAAGRANLGPAPSSGFDIALVRLTESGALDGPGPGAFGGDGKVTTSVAAEAGFDRANAVAVQPDGKIAITGTALGVGWITGRYSNDGELDTAFAPGGFAVGPAEGAATGIEVAGGRITVGGNFPPAGGQHDFAALRYLQDDGDSDGVADDSDNCVGAANADQANADGDGQGDACDGDDDGDGVADGADACPATAGSGANGCPVPTPSDGDGDGVPDATDACPAQPAATANGCPVVVPPGGTASNGNDVLKGDALANRICGLLGDDVIDGLAGNDTLFGDVCDDTQKASAAQAGADGDDTLRGGAGSDRLFGAGGNDVLKGDAGADRLFGGGGNDGMKGGPGRDRYSGGAGNDTISARDRVQREVVDCGPGRRDRAVVDRRDRVKRCEKVSRPRR